MEVEIEKPVEIAAEIEKTVEENVEVETEKNVEETAEKPVEVETEENIEEAEQVSEVPPPSPDVAKFKSTTLAEFLKAREMPKQPSISHTSYGGGEDEDTVVEQRPKKIRKKTAKTKKRADGDAIRDGMESPALDKSVIEMLYNDERDRYEQPALTEYLNKFIAYIHQNDTYGFRLRDDEPFDLCRKAAVVNKMQRFQFKVSPFSVWCKNENRREFTNVVFDKSDKKYPSTTLNLFGG